MSVTSESQTYKLLLFAGQVENIRIIINGKLVETNICIVLFISFHWPDVFIIYSGFIQQNNLEIDTEPRIIRELHPQHIRYEFYLKTFASVHFFLMWNQIFSRFMLEMINFFLMLFSIHVISSSQEIAAKIILGYKFVQKCWKNGWSNFDLCHYYHYTGWG